MNLTTLEEAAVELEITVDSLLNAVFERTIARPSKVFGWTSTEYARVRDAYGASTNNTPVASLPTHNTNQPNHQGGTK